MQSKAPVPILLCLLIGLAAASAAPSAKAKAGVPSPDVLDQKRIHAEYNEGNFDGVVAAIEGFMSRNKSYSLEDSVFIAKHLAVVYSANPETREKGKYYMYRLLDLLPSAKLIDMYVSDEIERIFDKVREEYMARQKSFGVDSTQAVATARPAPAPTIGREETAERTDAPKARRGPRAFYLAAGGTALVAVGVTSYLMFSDSPKKTEKIYDVD